MEKLKPDNTMFGRLIPAIPLSILILLLISMNTDAGIIYMRFIDNTGDGYEMIDVYQNDANSKRYIKTINMSQQVMPVIGTEHNYTLVLNPRRMGIVDNIRNTNQLSYLYHEFGKTIFLILVLVIILAVHTKRRSIIR